jgi:hypothetical protein
MSIDLDLDDLWPAATSLIGLQVATDAEFEHCQAILQKHRDRFRLINPEARYLVVRRSDTHLFAEAGLSYREIELIELDDLPPDERYERQRVLIQEHMPRTTSHAT